MAEKTIRVTWEIDLSGAIQFVSPSVEMQTGYTPEEVRALGLKRILTPDSLSALEDRLQSLQAALATGAELSFFPFEVELARKDGTHALLSLAAISVLKTSAGIPTVRGESREVTPESHELHRDRFLAALVKSSDEAIVGVDRVGTIKSWNPGAEAIYGYSQEQAIGCPVYMLATEEGLEEMRQAMREVRGGRAVRLLDAPRVRSDGRRISVSLTVSPVAETGGAVIVSRDVSDSAARQNRLIRRQRLESLETLALGVSHQFNNINTAIQGELELVLLQPGLSNAALYHVNEALASLRRAARIVSRLSALEGQAAPRYQVVRLNELVEMLLSFFEQELKVEGITLECDLAPTAPLRVDPSQVNHILSSLLSNAEHALLQCRRKTITVRTGNDARYIFLEVVDTGVGIPRANLTRIFTPFFTTKGEFAEPGSAQAHVRGVGLSLALCQIIVAENGGCIDVESEPGVFTKFRVVLPVAEVS